MLPLTILAAQKVFELLITGNALEQQINAVAAASNLTLPAITPSGVVLSSASAEIGDKDFQLTYPRICLYSTAVKNTHIEKFRSLSGTVSVTADICASSTFLQDT